MMKLSSNSLNHMSSTNLIKKNVLIIISGNGYVRNYMTTDAFSEIEKDFHCSYLVSDKVNDLSAFRAKVLLGKYAIEAAMELRHYQIFSILMWKYRAKSSSFYFRAMRARRLHFTFSKDDNFIKKVLKATWRIFRYAGRFAVDFIRYNNLIFPFYINWYKNTLKINAGLEEKIRTSMPSIILFPSSAYDPDGIDIVRICKRIGIPVLFLIDNWDNLSSKSILWEKPSHVAVWGEQSAEHAVNIQGFKKDQVTSIGTPRFDEYFKVRDTDLKSYFNFKYILFVGTALAFDEADVLQRLNDIMLQHPDIFYSVKIIYRPHPWRQGHDSIIGKDLDNVIIDPQIINAYTAMDSMNFQPDLSYYPSLLKNAEFVIGGLTSMIIEALIFRKRFVALAYDDGKNFTSQHNALKYYKHFQGLKEVKAISFCEKIDELEEVFISAWLSRNNIDAKKIDSQRRYFYFDDGRKYSKRLRNLCFKITDQSLKDNVTI